MKFPHGLSQASRPTEATTVLAFSLQVALPVPDLHTGDLQVCTWVRGSSTPRNSLESRCACGSPGPSTEEHFLG